MSNSMPSVLFYAADYLVGVIGMTWEEQGRYMYLLCLQQQKGHIDIDAVMPDCPPSVRDKFVQDDDGLFYNKRMQDEMEKRYKYVESRRRNLSKSVDKSVDKSKTSSHMETHMNDHMTTHMTDHMDAHMRAHMDNDNDNDNDNDIKTSDLLKEASNGTTYDKLDKTLKKRVNRKTYEKIQQTIS